MSDLRAIRERANVSRAKAAALADTTEHTARIYELDPSAVAADKRARLDSVYERFREGGEAG